MAGLQIKQVMADSTYRIESGPAVGNRVVQPAGVVLRELPWFSYRTPLCAAWHRINLRPLVETFRHTLIETATGQPPA